MTDPYDKYVDMVEVSDSEIYGSAREAIERAVLDERERCAKVADDMYEKWRKLDAHAGLSARVIRDAIRKDPLCQE